jgi:CRP/FNR family cyclic AMP-dependent transcriptional regulator
LPPAGKRSYNRPYARIKEQATDSSAIIDKLKRISFFAEMSEHDLGQIAALVEEKNYRPGEVIIEELTEAERFFIIYTGKIEITKRFEDGEEFVLAVQSDGDFFGEMALLDEGPRSATARAVADTTVLEISRPNFETLLYKAPVLAYSIMKELGSRLRETGALLVSHLQRKNRKLARAYLDTLSLVMQALEERDAAFLRHSRRVRRLAEALGRQMGLAEGQLFLLETQALLHELGSASAAGSPPQGPEGPVADLLAVVDRFDTLTKGERSLTARQALRQLRSEDGLSPEAITGLEALERSGALGELTEEPPAET